MCGSRSLPDRPRAACTARPAELSTVRTMSSDFTAVSRTNEHRSLSRVKSDISHNQPSKPLAPPSDKSSSLITEIWLKISPKIRLLNHICNIGMLSGTMTTLETASDRKSGEPDHQTGWSPTHRQPGAQSLAGLLPPNQVCWSPSWIKPACPASPAGVAAQQPCIGTSASASS